MMQVNGKKVHLVLFYANISLFWMCLYAYVPILSTYTASLGVGSTMVGTVISSYGFMQMVLRIPLGILSDKLKMRKFFVVLGMVLAVLSSLGMCFAQAPAALLIFRGLAGAAASCWVVLIVLLSSYFDKNDAPQIVTRATMCNTVGQIVSMFLGGQVAQYFGNRSAFFLSLFFGVCALVLSLRIVENVPQSRPMSVVELLRVAQDKTLITVSSIAIVYQMINQGAALGFTPALAKSLGATSSQQGILTSICLFGMLISSFLASKWLLRYVRAKTLIVCGLFITASSTLAIALFARSVYPIMVLQFCAGLGNGITYPLLMGAAIRDIAVEKRSVAMGFFQSIYALGMFAGPALMGAFADFTSIAGSIALIAGFGFVAFVVSLFALPSK